MDRTDIVSRDPRILRSLQYFEAVARLGSVAGAAQEAGVSASAVSHQLRALTALLGEDLVVKSGRGIVLTEAGQRLQQQLTGVFQSLGDMLTNIVGDRKTCLRLAVCSSFGPAWLAERLPDFHRRHPEIDLELRLYAQDPLQTESIADVIVTCAPVHTGFDHVVLFEEHLVPVASPAMPLGTTNLPVRLITTDLAQGGVGADWRDYSAQTGQDFVNAAGNTFLRCTHYLLAMSLAQAGLGAALVPDFLSDGPVEDGHLVRLHGQPMPSGRTYRICYKSMRASDPAIRAMVRWLKAQREAGSDRKSLDMAG